MTSRTFPWLDQLLASSATDNLRTAMAKHHPAIADVPKRVAILGAAQEGQRLAELCDEHGIDVVSIVDDAPGQQGTAVGDRKVQPSSTLDSADRDVPIIIASHITLNATQRLQARGFTHVSPFAALQVLHPDAFAPHMFHADWFKDLSENRDRYAALAKRLADDISRTVLDAVLGYRQTFDPNVLAHITQPKGVYLALDLFALGPEEVYVDAGAFDGDTIRRFLERTDGIFTHAYGFEPDPATFDRLKANFAGNARVTPINAGLWSRSETLRFHNDAGRASILDADGDVAVEVVTLDSVLRGGRATIVKMNIEGAELHALRGAAATIAHHRPKLAIAAYHRPSDLWEVPQVIDEIAPGYDLHLRQHRGGLVETVVYGVPE